MDLFSSRTINSLVRRFDRVFPDGEKNLNNQFPSSAGGSAFRDFLRRFEFYFSFYVKL